MDRTFGAHICTSSSLLRMTVRESAFPSNCISTIKEWRRCCKKNRRIQTLRTIVDRAREVGRRQNSSGNEQGRGVAGNGLSVKVWRSNTRAAQYVYVDWTRQSAGLVMQSPMVSYFKILSMNLQKVRSDSSEIQSLFGYWIQENMCRISFFFSILQQTFLF